MNQIPDLLNSNLNILAQSQPQLAAMLRRHLEGLPALKEPLIQETPAGRWVSGLTENPFFEKKTSLEKRGKIPPATVYLVFGTGYPPYLFQILRSLPREALSVIVFEPSLDMLLHTLSQTSVFRALPQLCRISFIVGKERALIDEAFAWNVVPIGIFPVSKAHAIIHPGEGETADFSEIEAMFKKEIIYRLMMLGNSPEDTLLGVRHAVLNTPRILRSQRLASLKDAYGNKPFVSVASGPSLEKNVHLLDDLQDRCVIVACDTILFYLLERGVVPHIVTTIERPYVTYAAWLPRVLEKYSEKCKEILLVSQSVSYPLVAGRWPGPKIVVGKMDVPVDNWFTGAVLNEQLLFSGLSVSHMALALAFLCEASSAALIGQDLAYDEGGASHASDAVPHEILAEEQRLRKEGMKVTGALGGMVDTSSIWMTFVKFFERMIASFSGVPVYDCTEGGALIEGTKVIPFEDYIEGHISTEACVHRWKRADSEREIPYDELFTRFDAAFNQLDRVEKRLQDMRSSIARSVAPALPAERRQKLAFDVATILDEIHAVNPLIAFIGQSYTHLSGTVLAENRFLETVEQVQRWKALHEEIVESHAATVLFLHQWLGFSREVVALMQSGELPDCDGMGEDEEKSFLERYERWKDLDPALSADGCKLPVLPVDILSCVDPLEADWSPDSLWKAALLFFEQGRAEEARRFMQRAYSVMEGEELETTTIGSFFKDWGKMAAADDLCAFPLATEAMYFFTTAKEYLPDDEELLSLQRSVLARQSSIYTDFENMDSGRTEEFGLLLLRNKAENALLENDLPTALESVEMLVWEYLDTYSATAISHLQWLMKTAANCINAVDNKIAETSTKILRVIVSKLPLLLMRQIDFPIEFLAYLQSEGIKFDIESSDNQPQAGEQPWMNPKEW